MKISAVVITKNEEKNIADCLTSLSWCDEILVVDDNSSDKTKEIARKYKAKVIEHALRDDFAMQRNFGLERANGDWVLFVDADERVSENLRKEILEKIQENRNEGYFIQRLDTIWGKTLRHGENAIQLLRLAQKGKGKWVGKVHEVWGIQGNKDVLDNPLFHFPHQSVKEFLESVNYYSTLRAQELHQQKVTSNWLGILFYAKAKFAQDYFMKLGFLDGIEGFLVATIMSFHSFLVRGKLWQLGRK